MFNSIKSKVVILTTALLITLAFIMTFAIFMDYKHEKVLMLKSCDHTISAFAERINQKIAAMNDNVMDLALLGEIYYKTGKSKSISDYAVKNIFKNYENSLGGGIWFEPFFINPGKRLSCTYAFRNNAGEIIIDEDFSGENYNYLNRGWYKEVKAEVSPQNPIVWTAPYYENEGSETLMTTVGAGIYVNGKMIGMSTVDWQISSLINTVSEIKPTPNSFALFADKKNDYILVSTDPYLENDSLLGKSIKNIPWYSETLQNGDSFNYHSKQYFSYTKNLSNGMLLVVNVPKAELLSFIINNLFFTLLILLVLSIIISWVIYTVLHKYINKPINQLIGMAQEIGQGNLDIKAKIDQPEEFSQLAHTFEKMTSDIKNYIANIGKITTEKEKMESELSIARAIQYSALPSTFYPNMEEFQLYATMHTAKEVGGDFYDFFFINQTQFMFLIADVSGKGIPAALFMMTTKTLIKNLAIEGCPTKELFEKINNRICENNKQGFFVTLFAGIIDIKTGKMTFINCGHNPPIIKHANGKYEYLKLNANLVLGAMSDISYKVHETTFEKDDEIFLYTDGVSEAMNEKGELYSEERLLECLNQEKSTKLEDILADVKKDVDAHAAGFEQSDDITMLCFRYKGISNSSVRKFVTLAKVQKYKDFSNWLQDLMDRPDISRALKSKIELVTEELFVNVASYAYKNTIEEGKITILYEKTEDKITMKFIDSGVKYNPLANSDPNIMLSAEDRQIGGLGIFMVKNTVDEINYEYQNNENILTIVFSLS